MVRGRTRGRAFSLTEVMVVLVIMSVLLSLSVPSFQRALEQSRADIAAANLQAIWSAERLYWLDQHQFTLNFSDLGSYLDPTITTSAGFYVYQIRTATAGSLAVTATRTGDSGWTGVLTIDETGTITGSIQAAGQNPITPGFQ